MHVRDRLALGFWSLGIGALALLTAAAYWPGIGGGFLFDDWVNLPALGRYGTVDNLDALFRYVTSGSADPTGRPVSMLSFLVDARNWPADPAPFKRTNIILHAVNGLLLYGVLAALGLRVTTRDGRHARTAALLAAGIWLLHPLWVSTVLYIVQRHAMLAAFFVLAGVRLWIASDSAFRQDQLRRGWWLAVASLGACGLLAGLSKANGFLLPVLLVALNASVLRLEPTDSGPGTEALRRARRLLVNVPAALVIVALVVLAFTAQDNFQERSWTIGQRLLTQPRIIWEYLYHLVIPGINATGIFADGYQASTGLFAPPGTAWAILALASLGTLAWHQRRRRPAFAAAVFFFFAGHAMESGALNLELYFEHRNYLPAALAFWPLTLTLTCEGRYRLWGILSAVGFLAICAACTSVQAKLWGEPERLAMAWADQLPDSSRAQAHAASFDIRDGRPWLAIERLEPLVRKSPGDTQLALNLLDARCTAGGETGSAERAATKAIMARGVRQQLVYKWLTDTLSGNGHCPGLDRDTLRGFVDAAGASIDPASAPPEQLARLHRLYALHALYSGDCAAALKRFNATIDAQRRPEYAQSQTGLLATQCGAEAGLTHLRHYLAGAYRGDAPMSRPILRLRDWIIARQRMWEDEWPRLESVLLEDLHRQRAQASPPRSAPPADDPQ